MSHPPAEEVSILIVDDEPGIRDSLTSWFEEDGFDVDNAGDARAALAKLDARPFQIVLLDIKMPGMDGMELLKRIRASAPDVVVIMITAFASVETAVQALKDGAFDYVTKPFDPDDLNRLIRNAIRQRALALENKALKAGMDALIQVDEIVGQSPAISRVLELVGTVSGTDATVLVRGETGTGKELIARAVHANSPRRYFPIITMNCGAVPDSLLESELFGHERGAFTGASHRRKGKLELANGGTLFLDEIGNVSPRMQMELLRVLETKRFARVGGATEVEVDFRLVCATNSDLEAAVREGTFREDLYYRINVFRIDLPPLRARQEDIAPLALHFVASFRRAMGKEVDGITPAGLKLLTAYPWPGNVRELRNVIERAMVVCPGGLIDVPHLRYQFPLAQPNGDANGFGSGVEPEAAEDEGGAGEGAPWSSDDSLADVEKVHIERVLKAQGGNISATARVLGVDRVTLYNKLKKYGIDRP
ncbi:MAG: sigma-54-dependent Fis family transcriptional regulator [Deltaproteobacteria bacterium]|nr:MAG: sigma-54-dependent Fis family transcriptional regulator [Deltaproteobacteria bacterium]